MSDDIPEALLRSRPELAAIGDALRQHAQGQPITARCIHCNGALDVTEIAATRALVITCSCGRSFFRAVR